MKQFITEPSAPTAQICINKSRLKIHNKETDPTYYLKSGQEFQMEFFNPTRDTILAKIYLNGKAISQGGLVLKPGERVFLNRYLDVAKKFLFDTYEVANTKEVKAAIEDNGDFKVEFFRESTPPPVYYGSSVTTINANPWNQWGGTFTNTSGSGILRGSGNVNLTNCGASVQNLAGTSSSTSYLSNSGSGSLGLASMDCMSRSSFSDDYKKDLMPSRKLSSRKSIETGRVEQGGSSDQKIKTISKSFDSWAFHTVQYKLLPISQKVNTINDINVAQYCTSCGSKTGKTDKFCAKCGTRI